MYILYIYRRKKLFQCVKTTYEKNQSENIYNSLINDFIFNNTEVKADFFRVEEKTNAY